MTFIKKGNSVNAIIETPKDSGAKYNFDEETRLFRLKKILHEIEKFLESYTQQAAKNTFKKVTAE
ncbi:MAG: inorganic diphosphatase [Bacteroidota bacterium]|nr:inorganic diphosphatase [Bacteroidota bacterium]